MNEFNPKFRYIIPLKVTGRDNSFLLFAIWAMNNKEHPEAGYIAQIWSALQYYSRCLNQSSIFVGYFNSNQIWDKKARIGNHTDIVEIFRCNNILSMYHEQNHIAHGQEKEYTFYMYRNIEKPYHIDYCFASVDFMGSGFDIQLCKPENWIE